MFRLGVGFRVATAHVQIRHTPRNIPRYATSQRAALGARRNQSDSAVREAERCPNCKAPLPTNLPACPQCFLASRPSSDNTYYDYLRLDYRPNPFHVDVNTLRNNFRKLQQVSHPDKWAGAGKDLADAAVVVSSFVNKAYTTLLNPYTRAEYILQLEGFPITESEGLDDPALIMEVMEAREELDSAESSEDVDRIRAENGEKMNEMLPTLSRAFEEKDWETAKKETIKLKYLQGIEAAAKAWPDSAHDH